MPRFAANVAYLFTERPLIERFAAAAAVRLQGGRAAVSLRHAPAAIKAELARSTASPSSASTRRRGGGKGEFGLAAMPGREAECDALFKQALDYIVAIGGSAIHCMTGTVPPNERPAGGQDLHRQPDPRRRSRERRTNITLLIEPINPRDRPDYFLNRVEHAADIIAKVGQAERQDPVRFLSCADRRRRSDPALREAPAAGRPRADRGGAVAPRAGRGRDQLSGNLRGARPARLVGLDRLRIPAPRRAPRTASAGPRPLRRIAGQITVA